MGRKIRLEGVTIKMEVSWEFALSVSKAIADLRFCPFLRRLYVNGSDCYACVMGAIEKRRARRELLAAFKGGGLTNEEFLARFLALDVPSEAEQKLTAQVLERELLLKRVRAQQEQQRRVEETNRWSAEHGDDGY